MPNERYALAHTHVTIARRDSIDVFRDAVFR